MTKQKTKKHIQGAPSLTLDHSPLPTNGHNAAHPMSPYAYHIHYLLKHTSLIGIVVKPRTKPHTRPLTSANKRTQQRSPSLHSLLTKTYIPDRHSNKTVSSAHRSMHARPLVHIPNKEHRDFYRMEYYVVNQRLRAFFYASFEESDEATFIKNS